MQLTFTERLILLELLPTEGTLRDLVIARNIRQMLEPTEAEIESWGIVSDQENKGIRWDAAKAEEVDCVMSAPQMAMVVGVFEQRNTDGKLRAADLTLCDKLGIGQE